MRLLIEIVSPKSQLNNYKYLFYRLLRFPISDFTFLIWYNNPDKGGYFKYCGQEFWAFISGREELYTEIVEPIGHKAKERNEDFQESYLRMPNQFTKELIDDFCFANLPGPKINMRAPRSFP
jgi:hypothetical protein